MFGHKLGQSVLHLTQAVSLYTPVCVPSSDGKKR